MTANNDANASAKPFVDVPVDSLANMEVVIRHGFVRKVFGIVFAQLLFTTIVAGIFMSNIAIPQFFLIPGVFYTVLALYFITACGIACSPKLARSYPSNYIALGVFTFMTSILVGIVCGVSEPTTVVSAVGITALVVAGLGLFAIQTKYDITSFGMP